MKRARAGVNVVSSSHHLTATVAVLATLAILNVDPVNVISMGPGGFTVNRAADSAHANPIMLENSATSVMMVTTTSLNAYVSHSLCTGIAICVSPSFPHCGTGFFYFCFQRTIKSLSSLPVSDLMISVVNIKKQKLSYKTSS